MARPTAPLLSLSASGTLAGNLVYSSWHGRPYVKRRSTPRDPRSVAQLASRALMRFLAHAWSTRTAAEHATWDAHPDRPKLSRYHCYLAYNADRWAHYHAPSAAYPASLALPEPDWSERSALAEPRRNGLWMRNSIPARLWAVSVHRSLVTGTAAKPQNAILWWPTNTVLSPVYDQDVTPGITYYYRFSKLSPTGRQLPGAVEFALTALP